MVLVAQDALTDAQHERAVALDDGGERGLVAGGDKPLQQLPGHRTDLLRSGHGLIERASPRVG